MGPIYMETPCMSPKEIQGNIAQKLAEDSPSFTTVKKWAAEFRLDSDRTEDDPRSGRPKTSTTDHFVDSPYGFA